MRKSVCLLIVSSLLPLAALTSEAGHLPHVDSFPKHLRALLDFMAGR